MWGGGGEGGLFNKVQRRAASQKNCAYLSHPVTPKVMQSPRPARRRSKPPAKALLGKQLQGTIRAGLGYRIKFHGRKDRITLLT